VHWLAPDKLLLCRVMLQVWGQLGFLGGRFSFCCFCGFWFFYKSITFWELEFCGFRLLVYLQANNLMGIRILWFRLCGDPLSFLQRKESRQRNAALHSLVFILKS